MERIWGGGLTVVCRATAGGVHIVAESVWKGSDVGEEEKRAAREQCR